MAPIDRHFPLHVLLHVLVVTLLCVNAGSNTVSVLIGSTNPGFSADFSQGMPVATGNGPEALAVGDFNHDGNVDIAVTATNGTVSHSARLP